MRLPHPLTLPPLRWTLPWPLPALAAWALAWALWLLIGRSGAPPLLALLLAGGAGALGALACAGLARRCWVAGGFPLSAWALGAADGFPAWGWLLLLLPFLLVYPMRAWRDAPFFPTPATALAGLDEVVGPQSHVFDAGCGLGHGLRALRGLWPRARIEGIEWSPVLALLARVACPWAQVQRGDLWAGSWATYDLVYAFQRPESMARLWSKAQAELPPGSWLVSLEFAVPEVAPHARLQRPGQRPVWIYRTPAASSRSTGARRGR